MDGGNEPLVLRIHHRKSEKERKKIVIRKGGNSHQ